MGLKHLILPNNQFKTHLFFSIFGWGGPFSAWILVGRVAQTSKLSGEAIWQVDTMPQDRSHLRATGPDFRLIYLFLRCRGTGPIFVWKQFLTIDIYVSSLKLSQLTMGLDPYCPQINISGLKMSFLELVLLLVQLHSWLLPDGRCKYDQKPWDRAQIKLKIVFIHENVQFGTGPILLNKMGPVP